MKTVAPAAAAALCLAAALAAPPSAAAASRTFACKLWVVPYAAAANVSFPAPAAAPDATFQTSVVGFVGTSSPVLGAGTATNKYGYTIGTWVRGMGIAPLTSPLQFSGTSNPYLGAVASASTPMSGPGWGVEVECTGTVQIAQGARLGLLHDDGASLRIDGQPVAGITSGLISPTLETAVFGGSSGAHQVDLLYANAATTGAWMIFTYGTKLY